MDQQPEPTGPLPSTARTRVVNVRREPYDVYIGRAGKGENGYFGNPFRVGNDRDRALARYEAYFLDRIERDLVFRVWVRALRGRALGCFCSPLACHGDVIVRWLEAHP